MAWWDLEQAWPRGPDIRVTIVLKMNIFSGKRSLGVSSPTLAQSRSTLELELWSSSSCGFNPRMGILSRSLLPCCYHFNS